MCLGSGFDAAAQVACPSLVPTTVNAGKTQAAAAIPADMEGAPGTTLIIAVYVQNPDGSVSATLPFAVIFPALELQAWTTVDKVCSEVPGFVRSGSGGELDDGVIENWIKSAAGEIAGALMKRGLSLNPADWSQPCAANGYMSPISVLEHINSHGAGMHLAAWVGARFTQGGQDWALTKLLERTYTRELQDLAAGAYDKLFRASGAATVETGVQVSGGDIFTNKGNADQAFSKDQVF